MNCFHKAVKDKVHLENCKFKKHGFMKIMDPNKKVCVIVNEQVIVEVKKGKRLRFFIGNR